MPKKKRRIANHEPTEGQREHFIANNLSRIVKAELHKLSSPITHINPASYSQEQLDDLIHRADPLKHHHE